MTPLVVNGWTIFAHPLFLEQLETYAAKVEALRRKDPAGYSKKNASKRLAAIHKLAFEVIPQPGAIRISPGRYPRQGTQTLVSS